MGISSAPVDGSERFTQRSNKAAFRLDTLTSHRTLAPARLENDMAAVQETIDQVRQIDVDQYKYGFETTIEVDKAPKGLSEEVIRFISAKKQEPEWMLEWRLEAYRRWLTMEEPTWARVSYPKIDFNDLYYYAAPKSTPGPKSLDEVDPELLKVYEKLGIPLKEQEILAGVEKRQVAVDAVFDSVSVVTTFKAELAKAGVIFMSISEAVREHPELVKKYLGSVVPTTDNFYATLNSAVFTDGSFVFVPKGVRCPMELSTYFRINEKNTGQFERTLIIADEGSYVHYVEGCTAPIYKSDSLHSAVVEIVVKKNARVRYTTIQNWSNNVYNLVTKRATCDEGATMEWVDGNIGSKVTMKYPAVYLMGEHAKGETLSIAFAGEGQHQDAGSKMVHCAPNTSSSIISKSVARGGGRSSYRGLVEVQEGASHSASSVKCDALLVDTISRSDTYPYVDVREDDVSMAHEATVSKVSDDQLFYLMQRGLGEDEAMAMIVRGFVEPIARELPMEYALELNRLIELQMEGAVG